MTMTHTTTPTTLDALSRVILAVNRAADLQAAMREVLDETIRAMEFDGGGIYVVDKDTRSATVRYHHMLPTKFVDEVGTVDIDAAPYRQLFLDSEPLFLTHYDRLRPDLAREWGWMSVASVPLTDGEEVVGALNVVSTERHRFTEDEQTMLVAIGREAGFAIVKAKADERVRTNEANLRRFFECSRDMLFVLGEMGDVVYVNPAVPERLGYTEAECLAMNVLDFHPPAARDDVLRVVGEMLAGTASFCDIPLICKDGRRVPVETRVSQGEWGGDKAIFGTCRDVSIERLLEATTSALNAVSELRDPYTAGHERRVSRIAERVAREMGLPQDQVDIIRFTAAIHDVGKAAVPLDVLCKPGPLTPAELTMVKLHAEVGAEILRPLADVGPFPDIVRQHHERVDGSGYPDGLAGDEIMLEARVLAAADVVEAMASHRPHRPALGMEAAMDHLAGERGVTFDADVVDACLRLHHAGLFDDLENL